MKKLRNWLIKKLGGIPKNEIFTPNIIKIEKKTKTIEAEKIYDTRIFNRYFVFPKMKQEIQEELCQLLAKELINNTKMEREDDDFTLLTTLKIALEIVVDEENIND